MDLLRLVLFCLVYLQVGCGFLLDGETDKVCSIMDLQSNMSMSVLLEYESGLCNSINNHFQVNVFVHLEAPWFSSRLPEYLSECIGFESQQRRDNTDFKTSTIHKMGTSINFD